MNLSRFGQQNQPVNAVKLSNSCVFWDPHKTHKATPRSEKNVERFNVKPGVTQTVL
jgi:hypothetical protein